MLWIFLVCDDTQLTPSPVIKQQQQQQQQQ